MNAYYIRCHPSDVAELLALGTALGVLIEQDGQHVAASPAIVWDVIDGPIHKPTGETDEEGNPLTAPICAPDGQPYWHANLYTPFSVLERAQQLAAARPEIAEALSAIPRFFVVNPATGEAVAPRKPHRVLA